MQDWQRCLTLGRVPRTALDVFSYKVPTLLHTVLAKNCDTVSAHPGKGRFQVNCSGRAVSVHVIPSPSRCSSVHSYSTDGQSNPLPVICNEGQEGERIFDVFKYYPKQRNSSKAKDAFK